MHNLARKLLQSITMAENIRVLGLPRKEVAKYITWLEKMDRTAPDLPEGPTQ